MPSVAQLWGEALKQRLDIIGFGASQQLAEAVGRAGSAITRWKKGEVPPEELWPKIDDFLGRPGWCADVLETLEHLHLYEEEDAGYRRVQDEWLRVIQRLNALQDRALRGEIADDDPAITAAEADAELVRERAREAEALRQNRERLRGAALRRIEHLAAGRTGDPPGVPRPAESGVARPDGDQVVERLARGIEEQSRQIAELRELVGSLLDELRALRGGQ